MFTSITHHTRYSTALACLRRCFTNNKTTKPFLPSHIAILGSGLTGSLSLAYHLTRKFPDTLVMALEEQPRLSGWVRSERVSV
jgi:hypothetical protein